MLIKKVFNNNVVLGTDERGTELVLLGRGLGFQTAAGRPVDTSLVEKTFVPGRGTTAERLAAFAAEIPLAEIEVSEEIVAVARERLGAHVTDHVLVPLADHVSFALRRAREGAVEIDYPLSLEVRHLYPAECALGREALRIIQRRTGVALPAVEAVPLALHFVNAQFGTADMSATVQMTEVLTEVLDLIRAELGAVVDEESVSVARFVTHLRYLFLRERRGSKLPDVGGGLTEALRASRPREYGTALSVAGLLRGRFGWDVTEQEVLYLALHVARLTAVDEPVSGGMPDPVRPAGGEEAS